MLDHARVKAALLDALADDWVYFAEVKDLIREVTEADGDLLTSARDVAAAFVRDRVVVAGSISTEDGFQPWTTSPEESAQRIEREVNQCLESGTEPELGDICWFDLP